MRRSFIAGQLGLACSVAGRHRLQLNTLSSMLHLQGRRLRWRAMRVCSGRWQGTPCLVAGASDEAGWERRTNAHLCTVRGPQRVHEPHPCDIQRRRKPTRAPPAAPVPGEQWQPVALVALGGGGDHSSRVEFGTVIHLHAGVNRGSCEVSAQSTGWVQLAVGLGLRRKVCRLGWHNRARLGIVLLEGTSHAVHVRTPPSFGRRAPPSGT
jgi:hypothetical protein